MTHGIATLSTFPPPSLRQRLVGGLVNSAAALLGLGLNALIF